MPKTKAKTVTIADDNGAKTVIKKGTKAHKKYLKEKQEYEAARKRIVKKAKKTGNKAEAERMKNTRRNKRNTDSLAAMHTGVVVEKGLLYGGKR